jgi:hypothetical protein
VEPMEAFSKAADKAHFVAALKARGLDTTFAESDSTPRATEAPKTAGSATKTASANARR